MFRQFLHRLFTGSPQATGPLFTVEDQASIRQLKHDFALLERNVQDHTEKTRRNLERYRARLQPRAEGKFGSEESSQSANGFSRIPNPTHQQIADEARRQGLIR